MAKLTVQSIVEAGITPSFAAADVAGDTFVNDDRTHFHIKNGGGVSVTATFTAQKTNLAAQRFGNLTLADRVVTVAASAEAIIPAPPGIFNNGSGEVAVTYDVVTTVTVAAFKRSAD